MRLRVCASFTVEAALLMPILFFTVFSALYLAFYVHNTAALTANAAEEAVTGRDVPVPRYMAASDPCLAASRQKTKRVVSFSDQVLGYTGNLFGETDGSVTYQKYDPTRELRWMQSINEN